MSASILFFLLSRHRHPCVISSSAALSLVDLGTSSRRLLRIGKNEWVSAVTAKGRVLISPPANPQGSSARLPQSEAAGFFSALSDFLNTSQVLQVLDLSENGLPLDFFPRAAKAPLQVLTLSGNHFVADTTALLSHLNPELRDQLVSAAEHCGIANASLSEPTCNWECVRMRWKRTPEIDGRI